MENNPIIFWKNKKGIDFSTQLSYNPITNHKEVKKTVRTGRPTDNPKPHRLQVMMSDEDRNKLKFCTDKTGLSQGEVVRQGIDRVYQSLLEEEKTQKEKDQ